MKTKNIFKTISIFAFSITAVIVLSVVLSGAWFTDDKGASTTITVGKEVKVTIDSSDVEAGALVLPGERVDFNSISIEVPETAANCYIRLTVSSNSTDFVLDSQTTLTGESSYSWIKQGKYFYLTPSSITTLSAVPESSQLTEASANTTYKLNISNILVNSALNLNDAGKEATLTILAQAVQSINYKTTAWVDSFGSEPVIEYVNIDGEDVALEVTEEATTLQDLIDAYNNASQIVTFSTNSSSTQLSDSTTCGWFADAELTEPLTPSANNDYSNILIADYENFYTAMATDLTTLEERFTFTTDTSAGTCTVSAKTYSGAEIIDIVLPRTYSDCLLTTVGDNESSSNASIKNMKLSSGITTLSNKAFYNFSALESITLPNCITSFGVNAFNSCVNLKSLKIPTGLKVIQGISSCSKLTSIEIPNGVERFSISHCSSLTTLNIPASVTSAWIGLGCKSLKSIDVSSDNANYFSVNGVLFNKDKTILCAYPIGKTDTSYTIPSSVLTILSNAFNGAENLTNIVMDNSLTNIGRYAFSNSNLTSIQMSNAINSIGEGAFERCESLKSIVIPEGVTTILDNTFYLCSSLSSVKVLGVLTSIGEDVFYKCSFTSIEFKEGLKSIGESAFNSCSSLTSITFPKGITSIGNDSLSNCSSLTVVELPNSVESIGEGVFYGCDSLQKLTLPYSLFNFEDFFTPTNLSSEMKMPSSLTEIVINGGTEIGLGTFDKCVNLEKLTLPYVGSSIHTNFGCIFGATTYETNETYVPSTLKEVTILGGTIGQYAFSNCTSLIDIVIGNDVTSIGINAFEKCSALKKLTLPFIGDGTTSNTRFGYVLGEDVGALREVVITGGTVEDEAFKSMNSLTSISLPNTATKIGRFAFSGCSSLVNIVIPDSILTFDAYAFQDCTALSNIEIPSSVTNIVGSTFERCTALSNIEIPDSVENLGEYSFNGCTSLEKVTLPKNLTSIETRLFYDCEKLYSIILPKNVLTIGEYAFCGCTSLKDIIIPEGITSISNYAFKGCPALQSVNFTGGEDVWSNVTIGTSNTYLTDATIVYNYGLTEEVITPATCMAEGTAKQTNYYGTIKEVAIPKTDHTLNENKVCTVCGATINVVYLTIDGTQIAVNAPQNATTLQDVINAYNLVNTDKQISDSTTCGWFLNSSLSKVITPTAIDDYSNILLEDYDNFYTCWVTDISVLETIVTFSGNSVSFAAYLNTHRDIVLPRVYNGNLITTIAAGKTSIYITSLVIPSGVETIAKNAFWGFEYLTSFVVPNSVTSIGVSAFRKCNRLQKITLPFIGTNATTTTRDEMIFGYIFGDSSFTSMVQSGSLVPTTLKEVIFTQATKIGRYAFYGSTITTITLPKTLTEIAAGAFYNCTALATINYEGSESDWANVTKTNSYIPDTVVYKYGCVI